MRKITFTKTVQYESEGRGKGPTYEEGRTYELRDDLAQRWINRDVAVDATVMRATLPTSTHPKPSAPAAKAEDKAKP